MAFGHSKEQNSSHRISVHNKWYRVNVCAHIITYTRVCRDCCRVAMRLPWPPALEWLMERSLFKCSRILCLPLSGGRYIQAHTSETWITCALDTSHWYHDYLQQNIWVGWRRMWDLCKLCGSSKHKLYIYTISKALLLLKRHYGKNCIYKLLFSFIKL
jgi:hypothetical protein